MAKQNINFNNLENKSENDHFARSVSTGLAQSLRSAFTKADENFDEIYEALTGGVNFAQLNADWTAQSGVAQILNKPTIPTNTNQLTNGAGFITSTSSLVNGDKTVSLSSTGVLTLPLGGSWTKTTNSNLLSNVATQVVWTSTYDFISGVKLMIQVEANPLGSNIWDTQVCEAVIAAKGYNSTTEPVMSVYGVTHTSVAPLMTFSVQRNPTTSLIEIVGTRTVTANTTGNASLRIYSVETGTND